MTDYEKFAENGGGKLYDAVMKTNATFRKIEVNDDIEWINKNNCTIEEKYREVKVGEKVRCLIYSTQNYFLTTPYYDTITNDEYHCCICVDDVEVLNAP